MAEPGRLAAIAATIVASLICGNAVAETATSLKDATAVERVQRPPRDVIPPKARDAARRIRTQLPGAPTEHEQKAAEDLARSLFDARIRLALLIHADRRGLDRDPPAAELRKHAALLRSQGALLGKSLRKSSERAQAVARVEGSVRELADELDAIAAEPPERSVPRAQALLARLRLDGGHEGDATPPAPTVRRIGDDGDDR